MAGSLDASTVQMRQSATQVEQEADTIRTELQALAEISRLIEADGAVPPGTGTDEEHDVADQIRVDAGSPDAAVGDISAGVAAAGTRLGDLEAAIAPVVATWEGSAQRSNEEHSAGESANTALWG